MEKIENKKSFYMERSKKDEEKKCVRVPVNLSGPKHWVDIEIVVQMEFELKKYYPNLKFTGRYDTVSNPEDIKEYLFFYE